jgi:peptide/nickel transport system permease protein
MRAYLIRRLIFAVVLVFLSSVLSFTILKASPGSAGGQEFFNPRFSKEYIAEQQRLFGLDRSPVRQYFDWLGISHLFDGDERTGLIQGDLGSSIMYRQPNARVIKSRIGPTLFLNLATLLFTWMVALPMGIWAAVKQYKLPDKLISAISFAGMSAPGFFMALLLLWIFASHFHVMPPGGLRSIDHDQLSPWGKFADYARHLIVPVAVLTFGALASLGRIMRGSMLEVLREQYVTTARAKGLAENRVIYKHALRNAINPLVTLLGFEFAALFGGAALLESVINFPGMGQLLLEALRAKDQTLVMATFLIGSVMLVAGNLIAEILLAWVDPRVSYD